MRFLSKTPKTTGDIKTFILNIKNLSSRFPVSYLTSDISHLFANFVLLRIMKRAAGIIFRTTLLVTLGVMIGLFVSNRNLMNQSLGFSLEENDKISKVLDLVQHNYVDSVNVDSIEG